MPALAPHPDRLFPADPAVRAIARASSSLARVKTSTSSLAISTVKALSRSGRESSSVITRSSIETARVV